MCWLDNKVEPGVTCCIDVLMLNKHCLSKLYRCYCVHVIIKLENFDGLIYIASLQLAARNWDTNNLIW